MIDIHHHLLHGLDDGSISLETSIAMAEMAIQDGITHIVCTPHASHSWEFRPEVNAAKLAELKSALAERPSSAHGVLTLGLTLGLGCDFHLSHENIEDAIAHPTKYTINGHGYLLVELPDFGFSANMSEVFYDLRIAGMTPILTHPERNPTLIASPHRIGDWLREGMLIQITANSLTGRFGKASERFALKLLADKWVHFIATDAHNTQSRPPRMREAYDLIAKKYGAETAERLCVSNPLAVYEGRPLGQQPEPNGVYEDEDRKSWWQSLLRR